MKKRIKMLYAAMLLIFALTVTACGVYEFDFNDIKQNEKEEESEEKKNKKTENEGNDEEDETQEEESKLKNYYENFAERVSEKLSKDKSDMDSSADDENHEKRTSSKSADNENVSTTAPTQTPFYNGSIKLAIISAESSSTLSAQQGNSYNASNVFDGNTSTAWAEGSSSNGTGEYIKVNLSSSQVVTMIEMVNGYAKSDEIYYKNCRVKKAELEFSDGSIQNVEFADATTSIQKVKIVPVETNFVKITIKEVYAGNSYSDLCISEIELYQ